MRPQREISHKGRIVSVSGDRISVEIVSESACAACRVSGLCGVADSKKKIVEIRVVEKTDWKVGQEVTVCLGQSIGLKAVFYSYVIPLLILLILILSLSTIGLSDWATGLMPSGVACYYLAIYFSGTGSREITNLYQGHLIGTKMTSTIIWTVVIITVLGLLLALVLYLVAQRFKVEEDPRVEEVENALPGANCGGCGFAGCHAFAEAAVKAPDLDSHYCPVGGNDVMKKMAEILGYEVREKAPMIAVVRCNGTCEARPRINEYDGIQLCSVKAELYAGDTGCSFGCLGCGDCVAVCRFDAIRMDSFTGLPVVDQEKVYGLRSLRESLPETHHRTSRERTERHAGGGFLCQQGQGAVAKKACERLHRLRNLFQDLHAWRDRVREQSC